jgi:hypothetical protein
MTSLCVTTGYMKLTPVNKFFIEKDKSSPELDDVKWLTNTVFFIHVQHVGSMNVSLQSQGKII